MKEKYVPHEFDNLILRSSQHGPVFGSGYDIYIVDKCHKDRKSLAHFPRTYNRPGSNKIPYHKDSWFEFSGARGKYFAVEEYEVFRVVFS